MRLGLLGWIYGVGIVILDRKSVGDHYDKQSSCNDKKGTSFKHPSFREAV